MKLITIETSATLELVKGGFDVMKKKEKRSLVRAKKIITHVLNDVRRKSVYEMLQVISNALEDSATQVNILNGRRRRTHPSTALELMEVATIIRRYAEIFFSNEKEAHSPV